MADSGPTPAGNDPADASEEQRRGQTGGEAAPPDLGKSSRPGLSVFGVIAMVAILLAAAIGGIIAIKANSSNTIAAPNGVSNSPSARRTNHSAPSTQNDLPIVAPMPKDVGAAVKTPFDVSAIKVDTSTYAELAHQYTLEFENVMDQGRSAVEKAGSSLGSLGSIEDLLRRARCPAAIEAYGNPPVYPASVIADGATTLDGIYNGWVADAAKYVRDNGPDARPANYLDGGGDFWRAVFDQDGLNGEGLAAWEQIKAGDTSEYAASGAVVIDKGVTQYGVVYQAIFNPADYTVTWVLDPALLAGAIGPGPGIRPVSANEVYVPVVVTDEQLPE